MKNFLKDILENKDIEMTGADWIVDIVLACGVFGIALAQLTLTAGLMIPDSFTRRMLGINVATPSLFGMCAIGASALPLVIRRKYSWVSFILCLVTWIVLSTKADEISVSMLPLLVSLVTLCALRPMEDSFVAAFLSFLAVGFVPSLIHRSVLSNITVLQNISLVFAGSGVGIAFKTTRDLVKSAELRIKETEAAAKANTEKRLEEERVAIARELHDITAHSLSAISIQAAAAEAQLEKSPEAAKETISGIRKIAKDSLTEIRRMIGVLREPGDLDSGPELAPSIGTEELNDIKEYLNNAQIDCDVNLHNYNREMAPKFVDLAIFGICREAATNIVKHAKASFVQIDLETIKPDVPRIIRGKQCGCYAQLLVRDNGVGLGKDGIGKTEGHGVEGMRERVVALGGDFDICNAMGGGTLITAILPLDYDGENE
ncbi:MAG: sensor histidine kinase [Phoenicibacter congonensis]|uniref:Sensor histidine kinase n=1 Tax=Phoenicibacter congonensis TaxID=1944646 RepID=A0AA43UA90_9ACTN|nr:sensor histidine kinase [Phoenicibacter congonensis]